MNNRLYYGDNLEILRNREYFPDECVDLIYLDPPFNSNRNYNVLFKSESGADSEAQITAFEDTWHWGETAEATYDDLIVDAPHKVATAIEALMNLIERNQMMAYLVMMTARLVELHRVLKPTGSLYLHCDPTASHYLKIVLDAIFGAPNFRNEIIWCYEIGGRSRQQFARKHDVILYYSKTNKRVFNADSVRLPRKKTHMKIEKDEHGQEWQVKHDKKSGKVYRYSVSAGALCPDWWVGIQQLNREDKERLHYPTQKPEALLERIIRASSNEGDIVLDPFCGCGTAIVAAQKLKRRWIGIDITHLSIALQIHNLSRKFELDSGKDYEVIGQPATVAAARQLAQDSANDGRFQFEWWALSLVHAKPVGGQAGSRRGKKGSDQGIDGVINFFEHIDARKRPSQVVVQVKSGKVKSGDIRDLKGTVDREKAAIGVFITLEKPTHAMIKEALAAGWYESPTWGGRYRRLQILTIGDIFDGASVDMPPQHGTLPDVSRWKGGDVSEDGESQRDLI